jgi:hypothetical protein
MDDTKPPVIARVSASAPARAEFARRAAMFSLAAPFVGLGFNVVTMLLAGRNRWVVLASALVTVVLFVSGVVLGIVALTDNRKYPAEGVVPRAVGGICISGFLLLMMAGGVPGLLRAIEPRGEQPEDAIQQPKLRR